MDIEVSLETPVEDLVEKFPEAVGVLSRHGVRCIRCGEPLWCTLGELLREEGIENPQRLLEEIIEDLKKKKERNRASK
ncbi:MAG: DUF1858 domain-containing protein [Candidatus Aminicenantes bacterium]|jgi:hypothetical protein